MISRIANRLNRLSGGRLAKIDAIQNIYHSVRDISRSPENRQRKLETHDIGDYEMKIDAEKAHQRSIVEGHDIPEKTWVKNHFEHKDSVISYDFGANIGSWTIYLATQLPDATVVALEPEPTTADQLRQNIELNDVTDSVTVEKKVASDEGGQVDIHISHSSNQATHGLARSSHHGRETVTVPAARGDKLTARYPAPDFIKIDVEGAEADVLRGLQQTLREHKPVLVMDIHHGELNKLSSEAEREEMYQKLTNYGVTKTIGGGKTTEINPTDMERPETILVVPS